MRERERERVRENRIERERERTGISVTHLNNTDETHYISPLFPPPSLPLPRTHPLYLSPSLPRSLSHLEVCDNTFIIPLNTYKQPINTMPRTWKSVITLSWTVTWPMSKPLNASVVSSNSFSSCGGSSGSSPGLYHLPGNHLTIQWCMVYIGRMEGCVYRANIGCLEAV